KLCVGISLIGHPPIVFLDEPSTVCPHPGLFRLSALSIAVLLPSPTFRMLTALVAGCAQGMDPGSRRFMWTLISSTMAGRSIMLTTHSMEVAVMPVISFLFFLP